MEPTRISPAEQKASKIVLVVLVLGGILIAGRAFVGMAGELSAVGKPAPPTTLGRIPDFNLTRHDDKPLGSSDLRGKIWIADFIFTRCAGPCPIMTQKMASLQDVLSGHRNVEFVTISVDPVYDTPKVLRDYAQHFSADLKNWSFLTGDRDKIFNLCLRGFKLAVAENPGADYDDMIIHSTKFTLVDRKGNIRGYYEGTDPEDITRLVTDVGTLVANP